MNWWLACFRMFASIIAYFSCFCRIKFFFFSAFRAYSFPLSISFARNTLPNAPDPRVFRMLKDEKLTLLLVNEFSSFVSVYCLAGLSTLGTSLRL